MQSSSDWRAFGDHKELQGSVVRGQKVNGIQGSGQGQDCGRVSNATFRIGALIPTAGVSGVF